MIGLSSNNISNAEEQNKENELAEIVIKINSSIDDVRKKIESNLIIDFFSKDINMNKLSALIRMENGYLENINVTNEIENLLYKFMEQISSVNEFAKEYSDYIIEECIYSKKYIINNYVSNNLISNYFKLVGIIMEIRCSIKNEWNNESFNIDNALFLFNSSVILNCLSENSKNKIDYSYYKDIYPNRLNVFFNKMILDEIKKYDNEGDGLESKIKNKFKRIETKTQALINKLGNDLGVKVKQLEKLEEKINKNNDTAVFVSLDQGYKNLHEEKKKEKKWALFGVVALGISVFIPVAIKLLGIKGYIELPVYNIYGYIGSATATFILLYYFRVSYLNYISIKTELTQIALRRNLCAFINGYSDFSERNKNTPETLKQFENIIFSNICSDSKNIPTTYDGIEQLAKLINALKSTPKS